MIELLRHPAGIASAWLVLHSLDYFLTLAGARKRALRAAAVIQMEGSYELNPVFQSVIDRGQWISKRFLLTLLGVAPVFALVALGARMYPDFMWYLDILIGLLVATRVHIILRHVNNLWLFSRMARYPEKVTGQIRYDRETVMLQSGINSAMPAALLLLAWAAKPSMLVLGGVLGLSMLSVAPLKWLRTERRRAAAAQKPGPSAIS